VANEKHVEMLRSGVEVWNSWREKKPDVIPDLKRAPERSGPHRSGPEPGGPE
jgi:hypothetical protein